MNFALQLLKSILDIFNTLLQGQQKLEARIETLEDEMATLTEVTEKLEADVQAVSDAIAALKGQVTELKAIVDDLQANGASPEAIARLEAVDTALDAITMPATK